MSTEGGYWTTLVVDDDLPLRDAMCDTLEFAGMRTRSASSASEALQVAARESLSLVISDVHMAGRDGHELLRDLKARHPDLPVVLVTAHANVMSAVLAMRDGAADYLEKPFAAEALVAVAHRHARRAVDDEASPVAVDPRSRELLEVALRVARSDVTVLITGESGTGKEVFARLMHRQSPRAIGPFVAINCAAIPDNMLEAVLFGHEKGAFTGAVQSHAGKFEQAQGGTLLLDEISEMSLSLQAKLLRVLQEREVERIGSTRSIPLDVRVVATSNRSLREEVAAGRFRQDLYYRLNVMPFRLPALRDRPGDILPLVERMLSRPDCAGTTLEIGADARARLIAYSWPGNVRELDNVIQRARVLATGRTLTAQDLVFEVDDGSAPAPAARASAATVGADGLESGLRERERLLILDAIDRAGSRKAAAASLGISPRTLRHKLQQMRTAGMPVPLTRSHGA
ncbi:MAG: sigma-54 dependent transcriptional regulator [Steroidobacteraceae bacterium]